MVLAESMTPGLILDFRLRHGNSAVCHGRSETRTEHGGRIGYGALARGIVFKIESMRAGAVGMRQIAGGPERIDSRARKRALPGQCGNLCLDRPLPRQ